MSNLPFEKALIALKQGHKVGREGWNGKNMFVYLSPTSWVGENTLEPFLVLKTPDNKHVPWVASQTDILAGDWAVIS